MSQQQRRSNFGEGNFANNNTNAGMMFNQGVAALQLGYWRDNWGNDSGSIRLSPAYEEPLDGKVFNYDREVSVFFNLSRSDIPKLKYGIDKLLKGEIESFAIKHLGESFKTILVMGNNLEDMDIYLNLIELDEEYNIVKDLIFNFAKDEDLEINVDPDTLEGEKVEMHSELLAFLAFIESVERVITKESQHQPDLKGGFKSSSSASRPIVSNKRPRDRKVLPSGRERKPKEISAQEAAESLFEE